MTRVANLFQQVAQLASGAFRGRRRIVQLMRKTGRELAQGSEAVPLLFEPGHFPDPIRHQADETSCQYGHSLHEFGKERGGKSQDSGFGHRPAGQSILLHSGKRQSSCDFARLDRQHDGFTRQFTAPLKFSLEQHEHCVCCFALSRVRVARVEVEFPRLAEEPGELVIG